MEILALYHLTHMLLKHKRFVRLRNTIEDILDENREACDRPIDCIVNCSQGS